MAVKYPFGAARLRDNYYVFNWISFVSTNIYNTANIHIVTFYKWRYCIPTVCLIVECFYVHITIMYKSNSLYVYIREVSNWISFVSTNIYNTSNIHIVTFYEWGYCNHTVCLLRRFNVR